MLCALGAWPWAHAPDGQLPKREWWRTGPAFTAPLERWARKEIENQHDRILRARQARDIVIRPDLAGQRSDGSTHPITLRLWADETDRLGASFYSTGRPVILTSEQLPYRTTHGGCCRGLGRTPPEASPPRAGRRDA
jgi:hypothetical protein